MDRRTFLRTGLGVLSYFTLAGRLNAGIVRLADITEISLVAETADRLVTPNTLLGGWQYRDLNATGPGTLASAISVIAGDTVNVTLENRLDRPVNFIVPGLLDTAPAVAPGETAIYEVVAGEAGTYFYQDDVNDWQGRAMGLCGPFIVLPADGSGGLSEGGETFDRQFVLMLEERDPQLADAMAAGTPYAIDAYDPRYYFVNGLTYPYTRDNTDTYLDMLLGETVLLRFINTGQIDYPMHFHGYHVEVLRRDRVVESAVVHKDTVLIRPSEIVDLKLVPDQPGTYPLHSHYLPAVTLGGIYGYGAMVLMNTV